jgi:hypothetical protein
VIQSGVSEVLDDEVLLRIAIGEISDSELVIDALLLSGASGLTPDKSAYQLVQRTFEDTSAFSVAFFVPTGIGSEIGGHAGDAGPVVRLLSTLCDRVLTHPNVVNASDINELPENAFYVEGSVLSRLLLGNIALQPVRQNRVLVVLEDHPDECFTNAAINSVNAARATYGLSCADILKMPPSVRLRVAYSGSGRATGEVSNLQVLLGLLSDCDDYDAIAMSS